MAESIDSGVPNGEAEEFSTHASLLNKIIDSLKNNAGIRTEYLQEVKAKRQRERLNAHLQQFPIWKYKIPQIGQSRLATILSFGIETAADIFRSDLNRAGLPSGDRDFT